MEKQYYEQIKSTFCAFNPVCFQHIKTDVLYIYADNEGLKVRYEGCEEVTYSKNSCENMGATALIREEIAAHKEELYRYFYNKSTFLRKIFGKKRLRKEAKEKAMNRIISTYRLEGDAIEFFNKHTTY